VCEVQYLSYDSYKHNQCILTIILIMQGEINYHNTTSCPVWCHCVHLLTTCSLEKKPTINNILNFLLISSHCTSCECINRQWIIFLITYQGSYNYKLSSVLRSYIGVWCVSLSKTHATRGDDCVIISKRNTKVLQLTILWNVKFMQ